MSIPAGRPFTVSGLVLTTGATLFVIWATGQWLNRNNWPPPPCEGNIHLCEQNAFDNLRSIARAQREYKKIDWNGDGTTTYAKFLIHLWTTVDEKGTPKTLNLIPAELGFATSAPNQYEGYVFTFLYMRTQSGDGPRIPIDYNREWACLAQPSTYGKTGSLLFLAESQGHIWAQKKSGVSAHMPHNPTEQGWTQITTPEDLLRSYGSYGAHPLSEEREPLRAIPSE